MSTTHLAQHLIYYQMKTAMNTVKYKLERELFYEEAIKHTMYDFWTEDQKEQWLECHPYP